MPWQDRNLRDTCRVLCLNLARMMQGQRVVAWPRFLIQALCLASTGPTNTHPLSENGPQSSKHAEPLAASPKPQTLNHEP